MGKSLLIIVLGFSTVLGTMMFNVTSGQQRSSRVFVDQYEKMITRNATESIANVALSKALRAAGTSESFTLDGVNCAVNMTKVVVDSAIEVQRDVLRITCDNAGVKDTTNIVLTRPAFSYYYYFVDKNWLTDVTFSTGDTLVGPVHANTFVQIDGHPVFIGKVSSKEADFSGTGEPRTYGGREFNTANIPIPNDAALADLETVIRNNGHNFVADDDLFLTFNADSSYDWVQGAANGNMRIADRNGTIMLDRSNKDIHVSGVLATKMTIVSQRDIYVENSITYLRDPRSISGANDYLGLIAYQDVLVRTNFDNIEIDAAILARRHFEVENAAAAPPRGTLTIFGSIVVHEDRASGVVVGSTLFNGYRRKHVYDPRLRYRTPPYFPRVPNRQEVTYRSN